jgi:hypothetical protein
MGDKLTAEETRVARHALGLPNELRRSYRNRYFVGRETPAGRTWAGMVERGLAAADVGAAPRTMFYLTRAGAVAALEAGESLCRECFPLGRAALRTGGESDG